MKKAIFILLILLIPVGILGVLVSKNQTTNPQKSSAKINNSSSILGSESNAGAVDKFSVSWFEVSDIANLKLIPNFSEKSSAQDVINKYNCKFLSNASFYAAGTNSVYAAGTNSAYGNNNQPLGLFISEGDTLSKWQENPLFNGILSINEMLTPRITENVPEDNLINAIQTGPLLKINNSWQKLTIQNDSGSRRIAAGITGENKLYFLVVYDPNSEYSGPNLGDLPKVLNDFELKSGIAFADIINLDGGAASAFYSPTTRLSEINPSGAFFCQP